MDENLAALLTFVHGEGHPYGPGITTHPEIPEKRALHEDCLRLEEMGLVYRYYESSKVVVWMPTEEVD